MLAPLTLVAALVGAVPAAAELQPVRRGGTEVETPLVRAGTIQIPKDQRSGRIGVVVRLEQPPLALRGGAISRARGTRLDIRSSAARSYLARLETTQRAAVATLRRAIPKAIVTARFQVVLNALAVELPARKLPQLVRLAFVDRVYPTLRYTPATNRSPDVIRAAEFSALRGAKGEGMKIAIVDDGVDHRNPFLSGAGYSYPPGFPRGGRRWTNGKIIVARTFPARTSGRQGRLAFVPQISFHGTHVAGIAAGNEGTLGVVGPDHPTTPGLSGVAPRAYIGNYRVFNQPSPVGYTAGTVQIVKAFEAAVEDGMDVINFSGGGTPADPTNDALHETVRNVAAAGVVPVIAGGNDREEFGFGTAGSPGTAPEAITVAATSNEHVFAPPLTVTAAGAPESLRQIPVASARPLPAAWAERDQLLVDVGTIMGAGGEPVERRLCGSGADVNDPRSNPLPPGSLRGAIALASRGVCAFVSKAARVRAAGAIGLILVDNRFGEANPIPLDLAVPAAMISDLDGAVLRAYMQTTGGRTTIRIGRNPLEIVTGRSGIITSFSSAGPTAFGHRLKPDVAAPGGSILSSTPPESAGNGSPFASFDGTSMAAPHAAGAAALLRERHRTWTPWQVKSALMTTARAAWGNTARTVEAPVTLEGAGLIDVVAADDPKIFATPASISFDDLNVNRSSATDARLVRISDAGGGEGTWQVEVRPQSATPGVSIVAAPVTLAAGGEAALNVTVRASAQAVAGDNFGFLVLRRGTETRKIPYYVAVTRPGLESKPALPLKSFQSGDTRDGVSHANVYRFPSMPFGPPPDYSTGPPMNQDGAEDLYTTVIEEPLVNFGAAVWVNGPGGAADPWLLGAKDENAVQGAAGTPVNINNYTLNYRANVGAAGGAFPRPQRYWFSVDSGRDIFTGRRFAGRYLLHSWRNDVYPPVARLLTRRVSSGRPLLIVQVIDFPARGAMSGVDPTSLVLAYRRALVGASAYDPASGIAVFALPRQAPAIPLGKTPALLVAADFQEAKNVAIPTASRSLLPNTSFVPLAIRGVAGPAVSWLEPERDQCVDKRRQRLLVVAKSTKRIRHVTFYDGRRLIRRVTRGAESLYVAAWQTGRAAPGRHTLRAVATDAAGRRAEAARSVRVCR